MVKGSSLRLLLCGSGRVRDAVGRCDARTVTLRLGPVGLRLVAFIIVVLVNIYVTSSWLVMLRTRSLFRWRGSL